MARHRILAGLATAALLGAGLTTTAAVAHAADGGQRTGPVQFWATDLGDCKAEFTIVNTTNVTSFTLDWRVDDEPLRTVEGIPFDIGRTGGMHSTVLQGPRWPDDIGTVGENTVENRWMVSDRAPSTATYVKDLKHITDGYNPGLPNHEADTHTVAYRMVLGPPMNNGETPDGNPEWIGDRTWHSVTVTGCNPSNPPEPEPDAGSLANIFGSLGSSEGSGSTGSLASLGGS